jgi:NAD-dependent SIR2 family protein deacetylase
MNYTFPQKLSTELREKIIKHIDSDLCLTHGELLQISFCDRCGSPLELKKLIDSLTVKETNTCKYCTGQIFKEFALFFPVEGDKNLISIEKDISSLVLRETER